MKHQVGFEKPTWCDQRVISFQCYQLDFFGEGFALPGCWGFVRVCCVFCDCVGFLDDFFVSIYKTSFIDFVRTLFCSHKWKWLSIKKY